jgi:hypothetical protein
MEQPKNSPKGCFKIDKNQSLKTQSKTTKEKKKEQSLYKKGKITTLFTDFGKFPNFGPPIQ